MNNEELQNVRSDLTDHITRCTEQFEILVRESRANTEALALLTEETRAIVQLHKDVRGIVRLGKGVQTTLIWCVKWPLIAAGMYKLVDWLVQIAAIPV